MTQNPAEKALSFLEQLRPDGPWTLTAIIPDGLTETIHAKDANDVRKFVRKNDGKKNLYYSVNPTRTARTTKASKLDIAAIEFSFVDLDPQPNETPETAKARYLAGLEVFSPAPTLIVDSGNGVQALWRLEEPIKLPEPAVVNNPKKGEPRKVYMPETQALIADVEGRVKSLMTTLGSVSGTQNIDRLLRLPGTTNLPNAKKVKDGRTACPTRLITARGGTCKFEDFPTVASPPLGGNGASIGSTENTATGNAGSIDWTIVSKHSGWLKSVNDLPANFSDKGRMIVAHRGNLEDLKFDLAHANLVTKPYQSWSEVAFALAAIFKSDGRFTNEQIAAALMCNLECLRHIVQMKDQSAKRRAVERLITRTHEQTKLKVWHTTGMPNWRERRFDGAPLPAMHNARLAISALAIDCTHDTFHNKYLFGYKDDKTWHAVETILGEVTDNGIIALRQLMSDRFGFDLTDKHARDAVISLALEHCFDPVCDMLAEAEASWDGVKRLDRLAADYFNCADTKLNGSFARKAMIAAVARARHPGCKFDTILVLESPEGFNKSTAWRVLAGDDNFSDESILGKGSREVQEQLAQVWIHENAELAGLKKADIDLVKAYASRQVDSARPAYGHFLKKQPRHSIDVGTTNASEYLQSQTGNRRFWPMLVTKTIDIDLLRRDRLQLWGEAAHCESKGETLVLDEALWADAAVEQENRRIPDAWEDALRDMPAEVVFEFMKDDVWCSKTHHITYIIDRKLTVAAATILEHLLKVPVGNQTTSHTMRLSSAMKHLGWERASNGYVTIGGKRVKGYFRNLPATKF